MKKGTEKEKLTRWQKLNSSTNKHLLILRFKIIFYRAGSAENMGKNSRIREIISKKSANNERKRIYFYRKNISRENFHINDGKFHLLHEGFHFRR